MRVKVFSGGSPLMIVGHVYALEEAGRAFESWWSSLSANAKPQIISVSTAIARGETHILGTITVVYTYG